jgi:cation transport ATPase
MHCSTNCVRVPLHLRACLCSCAATVPLVTVSLVYGSDMMFNFTRSNKAPAMPADTTNTTTDDSMMTGNKKVDGVFRELVPGLDVMTVIQIVLATPVQFGSGWPFYTAAYKVLAKTLKECTA